MGPPIKRAALSEYESIAKEQAEMERLVRQMRAARTKSEYLAAAKAIDALKGRGPGKPAQAGPRHQPRSQREIRWARLRRRRLYESAEDRSTEAPTLYLDEMT